MVVGAAGITVHGKGAGREGLPIPWGARTSPQCLSLSPPSPNRVSSR